MKGVDAITNMIDSNKRYIEWFLIALIVLEFMPVGLLGFNIKSNASKALDLLRPSDPNDLIDKVKGSTNNFHIYTFGGLKETNAWLDKNNYV